MAISNQNKVYFLLLSAFLLLSCRPSERFLLPSSDLTAITHTLDEWHAAASLGDSSGFFSRMTPDAVYIGTDATERWTRTSMGKDLGKHFDGKKAWHFIASNRHYAATGNPNVIHIDENLQTWMGPCRGSGLVRKINGKWYISLYNLANTVPNAHIKEYVSLLPPTEVLKDWLGKKNTSIVQMDLRIK